MISVTVFTSGEEITTAPPVVTQTVVTTGSDGQASVVTIIGSNPTPQTNNTGSTATTQYVSAKLCLESGFIGRFVSGSSVTKVQLQASF